MVCEIEEADFSSCSIDFEGCVAFHGGCLAGSRNGEKSMMGSAILKAAGFGRENMNSFQHSKLAK